MQVDRVTVLSLVLAGGLNNNVHGNGMMIGLLRLSPKKEQLQRCLKELLMKVTSKWPRLQNQAVWVTRPLGKSLYRGLP